MSVQGMSYAGALYMDLCFQEDNGIFHQMRRRMGAIPIMLRSRRCYLRNLARFTLNAHSDWRAS